MVSQSCVFWLTKPNMMAFLVLKMKLFGRKEETCKDMVDVFSEKINCVPRPYWAALLFSMEPELRGESSICRWWSQPWWPHGHLLDVSVFLWFLLLQPHYHPEASLHPRGMFPHPCQSLLSILIPSLLSRLTFIYLMNHMLGYQWWILTFLVPLSA